jgi:hypothetical protein
VGRELHIILDAVLLILQIHASRFEISQWGEMEWPKENFQGSGVQDILEFNPDWALSSAF